MTALAFLNTDLGSAQPHGVTGGVITSATAATRTQKPPIFGAKILGPTTESTTMPNRPAPITALSQ